MSRIELAVMAACALAALAPLINWLLLLVP